MGAIDAAWGYAMVAPLMIGLAVFYIWPIFQTVFFSFTQWESFGQYHVAGFVNYTRALHDAELLRALRNTAIYATCTVALSIAVSIVVAVLLNQKIRWRGVYRTLFFLPVVTIPAAVGMVWRWLYNGDYGLINQGLLRPLGLHGPAWIVEPRFALAAVVLVGVWMSIGYNMVLFLAGLQGIPAHFYEAASLDGAGPLQQFFRITLPLLAPTTFFVLVISFINAFQVFDIVLLMVGQPAGNPALEDSQSLVFLFYQHAFVSNDKGYAATISLLVLALVMAATAVQIQLQKRWVHYQ